MPSSLRTRRWKAWWVRREKLRSRYARGKPEPAAGIEPVPPSSRQRPVPQSVSSRFRDATKTFRGDNDRWRANPNTGRRAPFLLTPGCEAAETAAPMGAYGASHGVDCVDGSVQETSCFL